MNSKNKSENVIFYVESFYATSGIVISGVHKYEKEPIPEMSL
jgi:hypothetical protein